MFPIPFPNMFPENGVSFGIRRFWVSSIDRAGDLPYNRPIESEEEYR